MKTEEDKSKKKKDSGDLSTVVKAFATGAAAGFAVGILFAPDKGSNTREKVKGLLKELGDELGDALGDYAK